MIFIQKPGDFTPKFEVASCFFEYDSKVLFLHRPSHKSQGNKWGLPGGKIDPGETMNQAMIREIREETGVKLIESDVEFFQTVYVRYDSHDFIYHMFRKRFDEKPEIVLREEEHDGYEWFNIKDALFLDLIEDMEPCIKLIYKL